ncbi:G domain-containing protein [Madurella fahalii]|uniref:G domain-containing protein n=1 Tax=Madurella fahalii TaxID=1157608 RepID=A0ABQ0GMZ3_9PEZI
MRLRAAAAPVADIQMEDAGFILLMGLTGSGKSTFISRLTGQNTRVITGHSLASSTVDTACYAVQYDEKRVVRLIDTPGFDDTNRSDTEILNTILVQLATLCQADQRFLGIIFLHRITDVRLAGSATKTFNILQRLCGAGNYNRVILGTTMWSDAKFRKGGEEAAIEREARLREYWEDMFQQQSKMARHEDTAESAWRIIGTLIDSASTGGLLQIQRELVVDKLRLDETEAGRYVRRELLLAQELLDRELAELQRMVAETARLRNEQARRAASCEADIGEAKEQPAQELDRWKPETSRVRRFDGQDSGGEMSDCLKQLGVWTRRVFIQWIFDQWPRPSGSGSAGSLA